MLDHKTRAAGAGGPAVRRAAASTCSREEGPDHAKRFFATVRSAGAPCGEGEGRSKKQAEQAAAREACARLQAEHPAAPMPELPEVETVRRDLDREFAGKRSRPSRSPAPAPCGGTTAEALVERGSRARRSRRASGAGKYLLVVLDSGEWLVIHLRMSGQLLKAPAAEPRAQAHPRRVRFDAGRRAALRRPPDLRRGVRGRPGRRSPTRRPTWPSWARTRSRTPMRGSTSAGSLLGRGASQLKALLTDQR